MLHAHAPIHTELFAPRNIGERQQIESRAHAPTNARGEDHYDRKRSKNNVPELFRQERTQDSQIVAAAACA